MKTVIEARNLTKIFTNGSIEECVLDDINLKVMEGDFLSIMGPSGSGKSTLLYLLAGLDTASKGKILFKDRDINEMNDNEKSKLRRNSMGFVFQFYNLVPNLTVEENVLLPVVLDKKNIKLYKEKFNEIMSIVGLSNKVNLTPRELSGGQQQRVAIARALINEPEIIIADEPIGNLDSKSGTEIMNLLQEINKVHYKTIVQVTHSKESTKYGTREIYLKDGKIMSSLEV